MTAKSAIGPKGLIFVWHTSMVTYALVLTHAGTITVHII